MTQPTEPQPGLVSVRCGTAVVPGPDGRPWVALQIEQGATRYALVVDIATADQLQALITTQMQDAIATAKRQATGLLLPHEATPPAPPQPLLTPQGTTPHPR